MSVHTFAPPRLLRRWSATARTDLAASLTVEHWGYFLGAGILAALAAHAAYRLTSVPESYPEPIVGYLAWDNSRKLCDYAVLVAFVASFFTFLAAIATVSGRIKRLCGKEGTTRLHDWLLLLSAPFGLWIGGLLTTKDSSLFLFNLSAAMLALTLLMAFLLTLKPASYWKPDPLQLFGLLRSTMIASIGAALAVAALGLAINRVLAGLSSAHYLTRTQIVVMALVAVACSLVGMLGLCLRERTSARPEMAASVLFVCTQSALPLFFLLLSPTPWIDKTSTISGYPTSSRLWVAIAILMAVAWVDCARRFRRVGAVRSEGLSPLVSTFAAASVLVFLKAHPVMAATVSPDDYHFGELLVPWTSLVQHHLIPFWDYCPARGLVNYVPGALSSLFFDGTASTFEATRPCYYALIALVALPALRWSIGLWPAVGALVLAPYVNCLPEIDILWTAYVAVLARGFMTWSARRWLTVWFLVGVPFVLFAPAQGGSAVLATMPLGAAQAYRAWRSERWAAARLVGVACLTFAVLTVVTPLGKMILGAVRYVREQAPVNSIAHGIDWRASFGRADANPWLFELLRGLWLVAVLWAGIVILHAFVSKTRGERRLVLSFALPVFLGAVLFVSRAACRIDPGPSRLGFASIWGIALLLPVLMFGATRRPFHGALVLVWALLGGLPAPYFSNLLFSHVATFEPIPVDRSAPNWVRGTEIGLPGVGYAQIDPAHHDRLVAVCSLLDKVLRPEETFLDLTNRNAHYFYARRRPPMESGSVYNLVTEAQQQRAIQRLAANPPAAILLSADNMTFDGGPISLRAPILYRYILTRPDYKVVKRGALIWLIQRDRLATLAGDHLDQVADVDDSPTNPLNAVFKSEGISAIPTAWGRSRAVLEKQMVEFADLTADRADRQGISLAAAKSEPAAKEPKPFVEYDSRPLGLTGRKAGILALDFQCKPTASHTAAPTLEIRWATANKAPDETAFIRLAGRDGHLIIPLDSAPAWLLARKIESIRIGLIGAGADRPFEVKNVKLLQRHGVSDP